MKDITLSIEELEWLLKDQIGLTVEKCLSNTSYYNLESTEGVSKSLPIDKDKFRQEGLKTQFPNDFKILKKYLSK